jgi:hypothetical protein
MQSPEGSRLRGFYFRLHPLMAGERGDETTSDVLVVHYCERGIVFASATILIAKNFNHWNSKNEAQGPEHQGIDYKNAGRQSIEPGQAK